MVHYSCIGATGYVCGEVLRMMVNHPEGELVNVLDTYGVGDAISTHHPALRGFYDQVIMDLTEENVRETAKKSDVIMIQVPSGDVAKWAEIVLAEDCAIIDIGGQDVKGISIDTDGTVKSFAMNDKCSAGTGRFFEAMARSFEMSLPEFSNLSLTAKNVIPITAQCTVFAESEVITLVGEGKPTDEIAAGIEMAVAKRCFVMAKKAGATDSITLTGGCAKNAGLKQAIEHVLKFKVVELKTDPQLMGALGAAEYARQKGLAKK